MSTVRPKLGKTYLLRPNNLGLELSFTVDVDDFEFLYEDRETEEGHYRDTRCFRDVHRNTRYRFELRCYRFSDAIVPQGLQVDSPTFFFIHPLGTLLFPRVADDGELDHLGANTWGESTDTNELLRELLRARYPRALKPDLHPSVQP